MLIAMRPSFEAPIYKSHMQQRMDILTAVYIWYMGFSILSEIIKGQLWFGACDLVQDLTVRQARNQQAADSKQSFLPASIMKYTR